MTDDTARDRVHDVVVELALGIASEEDRAGALDHMRTCLECRREYDELARVAEALLLVGPTQAPPAGFESRVVERLRAASGGQPRWRRTVALVAAAVLGATAAFVGGYVGLRPDLNLLRLYRQTLEVSDGEGLGAFPLVETGGGRVGTVFAYEGATPWVFVLITQARRSGRFDVNLVTGRRQAFPLGRMEVRDRRGTFGAVSPISVFQMRVLEVVDRESGTAIFTAEVPPIPG